MKNKIFTFIIVTLFSLSAYSETGAGDIMGFCTPKNIEVVKNLAKGWYKNKVLRCKVNKSCKGPDIKVDTPSVFTDVAPPTDGLANTEIPSSAANDDEPDCEKEFAPTMEAVCDTALAVGAIGVLGYNYIASKKASKVLISEEIENKGLQAELIKEEDYTRKAKGYQRFKNLSIAGAACYSLTLGLKLSKLIDNGPTPRIDWKTLVLKIAATGGASLLFNGKQKSQEQGALETRLAYESLLKVDSDITKNEVVYDQENPQSCIGKNGNVDKTCQCLISKSCFNSSISSLLSKAKLSPTVKSSLQSGLTHLSQGSLSNLTQAESNQIQESANHILESVKNKLSNSSNPQHQALLTEIAKTEAQSKEALATSKQDSRVASTNSGQRNKSRKSRKSSSRNLASSSANPFGFMNNDIVKSPAGIKIVSSNSSLQAVSPTISRKNKDTIFYQITQSYYNIEEALYE